MLFLSKWNNEMCFNIRSQLLLLWRSYSMQHKSAKYWLQCVCACLRLLLAGKIINISKFKTLLLKWNITIAHTLHSSIVLCKITRLHWHWTPMTAEDILMMDILHLIHKILMCCEIKVLWSKLSSSFKSLYSFSKLQHLQMGTVSPVLHTILFFHLRVG